MEYMHTVVRSQIMRADGCALEDQFVRGALHGSKSSTGVEQPEAPASCPIFASMLGYDGSNGALKSPAILSHDLAKSERACTYSRDVAVRTLLSLCTAETTLLLCACKQKALCCI